MRHLVSRLLSDERLTPLHRAKLPGTNRKGLVGRDDGSTVSAPVCLLTRPAPTPSFIDGGVDVGGRLGRAAEGATASLACGPGLLVAGAECVAGLSPNWPVAVG